MPQHLTDEKKHLIVYLHQIGLSKKKITSEVGCSETAVNGMIERCKETRHVASGEQGDNPPLKILVSPPT